MIDTPKIIDGPEGQKLREQTLIEFVAILPESHLARRELAELQRRSSEMFRLARENSELKAHVDAMAVGPIPEVSSAAEIPGQAGTPLAGTSATGTKAPCRFCGKFIAVGKGYWARHLTVAHKEVDPNTTPQIV